MAAAKSAGGKGRAAGKRVGRLSTASTTEKPTRRQVAAATGDDARATAYRQGQGAAKRALDERPRARPTRGPAQVHEDPELQGIYAQGHRDTVHNARRQAVSQRVGPALGSAKGAGGNGAGFVLGLIGYALVRNFLTGGWAGDRAWLAAKFLNKTQAGVVAGTSQAGTSGTTGSNQSSAQRNALYGGSAGYGSTNPTGLTNGGLGGIQSTAPGAAG